MQVFTLCVIDPMLNLLSLPFESYIGLHAVSDLVEPIPEPIDNFRRLH